MKTPFVAAVLLTVLIVLPTGQPAAGFWWELMNGFGLMSLVLLIAVAFDAQTPSPKQALRLHQGMALAGLTLALLHTVGFLILDPVLIEHLKPAAPLHMWMAVSALVLMLVITGFSFMPWRLRVYGVFHAFRFWHVVLTVLMMVTMFLHVAGTAAAFRSVPRTVLLAILVIVLPVAAIVMRGRGWKPGIAGSTPAFGNANRTTIRTALVLIAAAGAYALLRRWPIGGSGD